MFNHQRISKRLPFLASRNYRGLFWAVSACAVIIGLVAAVSPAQADVVRPPDGTTLSTGAVFNPPGGTKIKDELESMIHEAEPGSEIKIALYRLWDKSTMRELKRAADKGVHVQVLVDGGNWQSNSGTYNHSYDRFQQALNALDDAETWAQDCGNGQSAAAVASSDGCNGINAMHNKFFLFSKTQGREDVISTSSANLSNDSIGGTGGWNSLYTVVDDDKPDLLSGRLYERYDQYFNDLRNVAEHSNPADSNYYQHNKPEIHGEN